MLTNNSITMPSKSPPRPHPMRAWLSVVRCYQLCNDEIGAGLKPLGLKVQHYEVLARLAVHPAQTQQELAQNAFVVKSHMSTLLNEMEALGWISRTGSAVDRRSKTVSLTPLGKTMASKAAKVQLAVMTAMFEPLSARQIAEIDSSTSQVVQALTRLAGQRREKPHASVAGR
jgi:DNA-binding MarR family transcriptional regulator